MARRVANVPWEARPKKRESVEMGEGGWPNADAGLCCRKMKIGWVPATKRAASVSLCQAGPESQKMGCRRLPPGYKDRDTRKEKVQYAIRYWSVQLSRDTELLEGEASSG